MRTGFLLFVAILLSGSASFAEYRVFVLKIAKTPSDTQEPASFTLVESTLDPDQYRGYHSVQANETVTYIDTWRCYGRTNGLALCPNPRNPASDSNAEGISAPTQP